MKPMNKSSLLLLSSLLLAGPALADHHTEDDPSLCELNINEIETNLKANQTTLGSPMAKQIRDDYQQALAAKEAGDIEACVTFSTQALGMLNTYCSGSTGTAGSGSGAGL